MEQPTKLLNRNFTTLWTGQFISKLGSQAFQVALLFMVKSLTGSASVMGAFGLMAGIPAVLLGPVGGAFADRYSRRRIIIFSDLIRGLLIFLLAFIVFRMPEATGLILGMLLLVAIVSSTISSFFGPAISAVIPDLVPHERVAGANSLGQLSTQISAVLGLTVGGIVYSALGGLVLLVFDAFSFLFAAGAESTVRFPQTIPAREGALREQLKDFTEEILDGLRYVWARSGLRNFVLLSALLSFFAAPVAILLTFYVQDVMQVTPAWYGFLLAFYGGGSMLGFILAGALQLPGRLRGRATILAILLQAVIYGLLGVAPNIWVAAVLMVFNGMMSGFVQVHITTIMQVSTPGEMRGRVFGLLAAIGGALTPIALGISGIIVDLLDQNIRLIFIASGIIMFVISLAVLIGRDTQELLAYEYKQEPGEVRLDEAEQQLAPSSGQSTNEESDS